MEDLCLVVSSFQHKFSIFYNNILFVKGLNLGVISFYYLVQRCKAIQQPLQIHSRSQCKQKLFCSEFEKSNFTFKPPLRILSVLFWRDFFYRSWTVGPLRSYNHVQVRFVLKVISASLSYPS